MRRECERCPIEGLNAPPMAVFCSNCPDNLPASSDPSASCEAGATERGCEVRTDEAEVSTCSELEVLRAELTELRERAKAATRSGVWVDSPELRRMRRERDHANEKLDSANMSIHSLEHALREEIAWKELRAAERDRVRILLSVVTTERDQLRTDYKAAIEQFGVSTREANARTEAAEAKVQSQGEAYRVFSTNYYCKKHEAEYQQMATGDFYHRQLERGCPNCLWEKALGLEADGEAKDSVLMEIHWF